MRGTVCFILDRPVLVSRESISLPRQLFEGFLNRRLTK